MSVTTEQDVDPLANYRALLVRVDELCRRIESRFAAQIACRPGCDGCCRHLALFPVEAANLGTALAGLDPRLAARLRQRARRAAPQGPCPLLHRGRCLLYGARPLICRTHGLPLLLDAAAGAPRVDVCPRNFRGVETLPPEAVIDLEKLNAVLVAVNRLFVASCAAAPAAETRLTIAEALRRDWNKPRE